MRNRYISMPLLAAVLMILPAAARAVDIGTLHCNDASGVPLMMNTVVTVQGVVTINQPTGTNNRLYIQDATGGINVFGTPQDCAVAVGDMVEANGTIIHFNGLTEVSGSATLPLTLTILSSGNPLPAPLTKTIAEFNATYQGDNCEPDESKRVKVNGLIRTSAGGMPAPGALFAANTNYRLTSSGADSTTNFLTMRVVQSSNACGVTNSLVGQPIPVACASEVIGILSQFDGTPPHDSGYQLLPGDAASVACKTVAVQPVAWSAIKRVYR